LINTLLIELTFYSHLAQKWVISETLFPANHLTRYWRN